MYPPGMLKESCYNSFLRKKISEIDAFRVLRYQPAMSTYADSLAQLEQVTPHARHLDDAGKRAARSAYSARKKELQA